MISIQYSYVRKDGSYGMAEKTFTDPFVASRFVMAIWGKGGRTYSMSADDYEDVETLLKAEAMARRSQNKRRKKA